MSDVEDLVRATLLNHADDAPPPDRLAESVRAQRHRSRRTRQALTVVAVAAATAAAVVIPLTLTASGHEGSKAVTAPNPKPATEQVIGFHGIEITVPASWAINDLRCGTAVSNSVIRDAGPVLQCAILHPAGVSSVELTSNLIGTVKLIRETSDVTNPHGVRLQRGKAGRQTGVIIPTAGVVMFVDANPATTQRILDSVRRVAIDTTGCKMRETKLQLPIAIDPTRGPYVAYVIPPGATSIAICHYEGNWLASSAVVTGDALANLVHQANVVPKGFVHAPPSRGGCAPGSVDDETRSGYILLAHYPDGTTRRLWAHIGYCGPLGITNGQRAGALTLGLARAINDPLHHGFGLPGGLLPGP